MRILIDTNVLISAALNSNSIPYQAYIKASSYPNRGLICEQNIEEIEYIFRKKFPAHISVLNHFLAIALSSLELVPIPAEREKSEIMIRDADDRSILRAAIAAEADIILTGDKDFLEAGLVKPKAMTPSEFLRLPI